MGKSRIALTNLFPKNTAHMYSGQITLSEKESDRAKRNLIFSPNAGEKKQDWEYKHNKYKRVSI